MEPLYLENSRVFAIGDVHGCLYTVKKLVEEHWNPDKEILVQLGDLLNRGRYSVETVQYFFDLKDRYPDKVYTLMGNHEYDLLQYLTERPHLKWLRSGGSHLIYEMYGADAHQLVLRHLNHLIPWIETPAVFLSHAGRPEGAGDKTPPESPIGVYYNRQPLVDIGKTQVIGHVPCKSGIAEYRKKSQSWRIDTGAYLGKALTGVKISKKGIVKEVVRESTHQKDIKKLTK
jgi:serine/threonine protein phosphatase 1